MQLNALLPLRSFAHTDLESFFLQLKSIISFNPPSFFLAPSYFLKNILFLSILSILLLLTEDLDELEDIYFFTPSV